MGFSTNNEITTTEYVLFNYHHMFLYLRREDLLVKISLSLSLSLSLKNTIDLSFRVHTTLLGVILLFSLCRT